MDQTQRSRKILKTLHCCIRGGFKLLFILSSVIADDLKGELLTWTTTVFLRKTCSFSEEIEKALTLSTNNNNNSTKQMSMLNNLLNKIKNIYTISYFLHYDAQGFSEARYHTKK